MVVKIIIFSIVTFLQLIFSICFIVEFDKIMRGSFIENSGFLNNIDEDILPIINLEYDDVSGISQLEELFASKNKVFSSGYLNLRNRSFKYAKLNGLKFRKVNFRGTDFSNAKISGSSFSDCVLLETKWESTSLRGCELDMVVLERVSFSNTIFLDSVSFTNSNLKGCDIRNIEIPNSDFSNTNCLGINFSGGKLNGAVFKSSNLGYSKIIGAELDWADFSCSNVEQVDFTGASVENSKFAGANLYRAKFYGTMCYKSDFSFTDLRYTHFQGSELRKAIFNGAIFYVMKPEILSKKNESPFEYYQKKGYSLSNIKGAITANADGYVLKYEDGNELILFNDWIYRLDKNKFEKYIDSLETIIKSELISNDTNPGQRRQFLYENFRDRMLKSYDRFVVDTSFNTWQPSNIQFYGVTEMNLYLNKLDKERVGTNHEIKCFINSIHMSDNDSILQEMKKAFNY